MFSSIVRNVKRTSCQLQVESLEGRDMPSTLPMLAPPPAMYVSAAQSATVVHQMTIGEEIPSLARSSVSINLLHIGEEIPQ